MQNRLKTLLKVGLRALQKESINWRQLAVAYPSEKLVSCSVACFSAPRGMVALPKVSEGNSTLSKCPRKTVALQDDLADKEEDNWTMHSGLYGSSNTTSALGNTCRQCKGERLGLGKSITFFFG
jgi:hypothetical protein